ncbi:unnamed protein product [Echinostoma caproni]|uniref:Similar to n=1 Tax=Echinostoma caproni TaxID=27848 RepID=A0A183B2I4_9TREM|nr:unnamed protein product [Echinostoma caproni]
MVGTRNSYKRTRLSGRPSTSTAGSAPNCASELHIDADQMTAISEVPAKRQRTDSRSVDVAEGQCLEPLDNPNVQGEGGSDELEAAMAEYIESGAALGSGVEQTDQAALELSKEYFDMDAEVPDQYKLRVPRLIYKFPQWLQSYAVVGATMQVLETLNLNEGYLELYAVCAYLVARLGFIVTVHDGATQEDFIRSMSFALAETGMLERDTENPDEFDSTNREIFELLSKASAAGYRDPENSGEIQSSIGPRGNRKSRI